MDVSLFLTCWEFLLRHICIYIQVSNSGTEDSNLFDDDPFYDDFNMDEVDLSIENYEELFGVSIDNRDQLFKNEDIDGLFGTKDMSVAESSFQGVNAVEVVYTS